MSTSLLRTIRTKYNTLSEVQKKVADYVLDNAQTVIMSSLSSVAEACDTSETTVIRFLRKVKCESYQVFKVRIAQELADVSSEAVYENIEAADNTDTVAKTVIHLTVEAMKDLGDILDTAQVQDCVDAIAEAKRIVFIGVGASANVAADAFHKFLRIGLDVIVCNDTHIMSIQCANLCKDDLVIAFTHSGESREILKAIELAKAKEARIAVVTSYSNSSVTRLSDILLLSPSCEIKYRSDAMTSRILQLVIIDILYVSTVLKIGPSSINKLNESRLAVATMKI